VAALSAAARVRGAAQLVVAIRCAAAVTARRRLAVRARAALGAAAAQGFDGTFASLARADGAGIVVLVALRIVAAFGGAAGTLAFAAERAGAVGVGAQVVLARVGRAGAAVVASLGDVFAWQDAARLASAAAAHRGAILGRVTFRVVGHEHALAHEALVVGAGDSVVAVTVLAALSAVALAAVLRAQTFG